MTFYHIACHALQKGDVIAVNGVYQTVERVALSRTRGMAHITTNVTDYYWPLTYKVVVEMHNERRGDE